MGLNNSKTSTNLICCGKKVSKEPVKMYEIKDFDAMAAAEGTHGLMGIA